MTFSTLADYYAKKDFLPTYGRFQTLADLEQHIASRSSFLNNKMYLPTRLFYGARLLEFGPDTAENSLAFASWGATCSLVEPNVKAHPVIREYFARYGYSTCLERISDLDIAQYAEREVKPEYDFVIAEGFVYTVQPASLWLDLFARLLRPGGMALISYYEFYGGQVELLTKRVYNRVKELTGWDGLEVAHVLFDNKWATIPHMRTLEQWRLDVLENPFVSEPYFLEAEWLCQQAQAAGLRLYSSWPQYRGIDVYWHKQPEPMGSRARFIEQQRPIWQYGGSAGHYCISTFQQLLKAGDVDAIVRFSQTDGTWLKLWGQPCHFSCFQKV